MNEGYLLFLPATRKKRRRINSAPGKNRRSKGASRGSNMSIDPETLTHLLVGKKRGSWTGGRRKRKKKTILRRTFQAGSKVWENFFFLPGRATTRGEKGRNIKKKSRKSSITSMKKGKVQRIETKFGERKTELPKNKRKERRSKQKGEQKEKKEK